VSAPDAQAGGLRRLVRPRSAVEPMVHAGTHRAWLRRGDWQLLAAAADGQPPGDPLVEFATEGAGSVAATLDSDGLAHVPFDPHEAYETYVSERWMGRSDHRRLSESQLNAFYRIKRLVPRGAQLSARRRLIRWQGLPTFPSWPLELGVANLARFYLGMLAAGASRPEQPFDWFWPDGATAAVTLSHDVESAEGLQLVLKLADIEEELGFRSSFNLGAWYEPDYAILDELRARGFELGSHGLKHDRSLFVSREGFDERRPALRAVARGYGAVGFRSPATHRQFDWLEDLPFDYDGSIPHSDPFEPQPGGCCTLWPFFIGDVVEIPYTMPQDHTLFTLLGDRTPARWIDISRQIEEQHGLIHCVSHPDPGYLGDAEKAARYREFLAALAERPLWRALPRDVSTWWRRRDAGLDVQEAVAVVGERPDEVELRPPGRPDAVTVQAGSRE
jgi:peptidoglycan/xylan/chitin deacetylase (PgdA/CDA1 family)